jgi:hypothetical protein
MSEAPSVVPGEFIMDQSPALRQDQLAIAAADLDNAHREQPRNGDWVELATSRARSKFQDGRSLKGRQILQVVVGRHDRAATQDARAKMRITGSSMPLKDK